VKATIPTPVSERDVKDESAAVEYLNKEVRPLLRQMRGALNNTTDESHTLTTAATGTFTAIWTSDALKTNSAMLVEGHVIGRASAGAAQRVAYVVRALFYNAAGTVAQQGSTVAGYTEESSAGCDVRFRVSGQTVILEVVDDSASTFQWRAWVKQFPSLELPA